MLNAYQQLGYYMLLKTDILHSHFFPVNTSSVGDEYGEKFDQVMAEYDKGYRVDGTSPILRDYCWRLQLHCDY